MSNRLEDGTFLRAPRARRRRSGSRVLTALGLAVATGASVTAAGAYYTNAAVNAVPTIDFGSGVLDPKATGPTKVENYLLVGSDSRVGADTTDIDYGGIGKDIGNSRSDTILVLRYDPKAKTGFLLSIPRDLLVTIADSGKENRVNSAFERDDPKAAAANLIETVKSIGLPINHYVEVNFNGFKQLVEAAGGVRVYFPSPVRDNNTGLDVPRAQCVLMSGQMARQYVRARHLEVFRKGHWVPDDSADYGRMARQRDFIQRAIDQTIAKASGDPTVIAHVLEAATSNVQTDPQIDLGGLANQLRAIGSGRMTSLSLPTTEKKVKLGNSLQDVLVLDGAQAAPILAFYKGEGPNPLDVAATPAPPDSTAAPAAAAATVAAPDPAPAPVAADAPADDRIPIEECP